ncbi:WecB/TagA/CpsF family glycosyltransferase [Pleurocapsa sp. PCC 7319]|uniref:WecB/TagA/CpsF family glycosyltransferase n=1 Tax=Pleurocapsa sp. PCC 7319 TaxID=118161 RepID=UPI00034DCDB6|nr:WecB/TagA/CpsF family glycosyltransferase [Pleurocapsa sp. PCC 7319]
MDVVDFLNVSIHNITIHELLTDLNYNGGFVVTPNVDHLVQIQSDRELLKAYYYSNYRVCDSKILQYISFLLGNPIKEKISGSDLFPAFYEYNKYNEDIRIFLLGAKEGVAQQALVNINQKVGRDIIVGAYSPSFGFEQNEPECQAIVERINHSEATVLAVGVGAPKQEKWIAKYRQRLHKIKIFLAIGATIDFEAGTTKRAPKIMSEIGLEWLYRLFTEPNRLWKRYLVDSLPLLWLVSKQKINQYRFPHHLQTEYLPLGEILQQAGLLSPQDIRQALKIQEKDNNYRFGEILINQGRLKPETVNFFVNYLPQLVYQANKLRLGDYLNSAGLLNLEQISETIQQQSLTKRKFGEIVIQKGWVNPKTVNWFVNLQND